MKWIGNVDTIKSAKIVIKGIAVLVAMLCATFVMTGCEEEWGALNEEEISQAQELLEGISVEISDISELVLTPEIKKEFDSIRKISKTRNGDYIVVGAPIGYNGPIKFMMIVDGKKKISTHLSILSHMETEEYVRDMENSWFTDRFVNKKIEMTLRTVKLEDENEEDVVAITGSTMTTDAMVKGVNDAFGILRTIKENGEISFVTGKTVIGAVSLEDIKELESYRRKMAIKSSKGETEHDFRGARLSDVMALLDQNIDGNYTKVSSNGSDGYTSEMTMEEVLEENNVYVMYEDSGKPIKTKLGDNRGMRLVVLNDAYGQRFTNYLYEIELKK